MAAAFGTNVSCGHDGLRELVAAAEEGFESYTAVHEETRTTSDGALLTRGHIDVQSRGTHIELFHPDVPGRRVPRWSDTRSRLRSLWGAFIRSGVV
jgi:hypothetical protein